MYGNVISHYIKHDVLKPNLTPICLESFYTVTVMKYNIAQTHTQYSTLTRKFKDIMEEYNNIQETYREKNKERIQKQLQYGELSTS